MYPLLFVGMTWGSRREDDRRFKNGRRFLFYEMKVLQFLLERRIQKGDEVVPSNTEKLRTSGTFRKGTIEIVRVYRR